MASAAQIVDLLGELSQTQDELLELLLEKQRRLTRDDLPGLAELRQREQHLLARLQACHTRRGELLATAEEQGLPADSLASLTGALSDDPQQEQARAKLLETSGHARLLRHQALTAWVATQRSLLHLSHLLEILASGGRPMTTYEQADRLRCSGALLDQCG